MCVRCFGVKMQQIQGTKLDNMPTGYYLSKREKDEQFCKDESHIYDQTPLADVQVAAHKLSNDVLTYFPKAFQGSKNSDFYEFLSLGLFPYITGGLTMIAAYCFGKKSFNNQDAHQAGMIAKNVAAGAGLYALGKYLSPKLSRTMIHASTTVNLDEYCLKKVNELPEKGQEKGEVRPQYPKWLDSVDFAWFQLKKKQGEMKHDNMYHYADKAVEKMGFKEKLNDSTQIADPAIRKLKTRATAMENITKYVVAATGVLIGWQQAFKDVSFEMPKSLKSFTHQLTVLPNAVKEGTKQLWKGSSWGKGMLIASAALTVLDWLVPSLAFKKRPDTIKTQLDPKKESEVC